MIQGESLPSAYSRIYRAIGRQQAILKAKATIRSTHNPNPLDLETEAEALDKMVPASGMVDRAMLHTVEANLWEMMGE